MIFLRFILAVLLISFVSALREVNNDAQDFLEETHGKIIHASVLFRHGERTPTTMYPNDKYPASLWPEGLGGQLTKAGKQRLYDVGKWFRERYLHLGLSQGYRFDRLLMNSSDYDRTIMCAEVFLAGLLPPLKNETWADDGLPWQPIPVHVMPLDTDTVIAQVTPCQRMDLEKNKANQSPELQDYYEKNKKFLEYLIQKSGYNESKSDILKMLMDLSHVYNSFVIEEARNLPLPPWAKFVYPESLTSMFTFFLVSLALTPEMRRLQGGPTIGSMISDMQQKRSGLTNQTFHFYSGHDTTIVALLYTLGIFDNLPPPYGAAVIVELRRKDTEFVVTILYRNETNVRPYLLTLPECGYICTLDKFIEVTKQWIPDSHEDECKVGLLENLFTYGNTITTILICVLLLLIFGVLAYCILLCVRRTSATHAYYSL